MADLQINWTGFIQENKLLLFVEETLLNPNHSQTGDQL